MKSKCYGVSFCVLVCVLLGACQQNNTSQNTESQTQSTTTAQSNSASQTPVGKEGLPYFRPALKERYDAYAKAHPNLSDEAVVTEVNIGLDIPLSDPNAVSVITEPIKPETLVNKRHALPEDFVPQNLVPTPAPCVQGVDYSCQAVDQQELNQEAADHLQQWVDAAAAQGIEIKTIASYRSVAYQKVLFDHAEANNGREYAEKYYAKPGQSEHNTGYAIDITIEDTPYEEVHTNPHYEWVLAQAPQYGYILRYTEDKKHIHEYEYESWHFRYVGTPLAQYLTENQLTLEEYYARLEQ